MISSANQILLFMGVVVVLNITYSGTAKGLFGDFPLIGKDKSATKIRKSKGPTKKKISKAKHQAYIDHRTTLKNVP